VSVVDFGAFPLVDGGLGYVLFVFAYMGAVGLPEARAVRSLLLRRRHPCQRRLTGRPDRSTRTPLAAARASAARTGFDSS